MTCIQTTRMINGSNQRVPIGKGHRIILLNWDFKDMVRMWKAFYKFSVLEKIFLEAIISL